MHSHQWQFGRGKKWVIYIFCIDSPKSALAASQLPTLLVFLPRVASYREKDCFSLSLLFHFEFSIFSQFGKINFNSSEVILGSQSSPNPPFFPSFSLSFLAVIVSRANRCLH